MSACWTLTGDEGGDTYFVLVEQEKYCVVLLFSLQSPRPPSRGVPEGVTPVEGVAMVEVSSAGGGCTGEKMASFPATGGKRPLP